MIEYHKQHDAEGESTGETYFTIEGENGEVQATGEAYTRPSDATRAVADLARTILRDVAAGRIVLE